MPIPPAECIPRIRSSLVPPAERTPAFELELLVRQLHGYGTQFRHVIDLFHHATALEFQNKHLSLGDGDRKRFRDWRFIAADYGAISINHFGNTVRSICGNPHGSIDGALARCPSLKTLMPTITEEVLLANRLDDFWSVRHGVVHVVENQRPEQIDKHRVGPAFEAGNLLGEHYVFTVKGVRHSYKVSHETTDILGAIISDLFGALNAAIITLSLNDRA
jgi:hypothetical protein